ncbi:fasciclin domain-containing protein [Belliella sp. DSM 111904]|uniref:Fasciclin domain-containing protein n=1 Tax=Belliella filtrata TaxID=2923435 RepID=A0ABS9V3S7_9BACT|nr:fasciclin domain-containing protein [Belliella filtrata]MCH7411063.1 fasciclin domain-containing protein [Belliella filtrata]
MKYLNKISLLLVIALFAFSSCIDKDFALEPTGLTEKPILSNVLAEQADLSIFLELVEANNLLGNLVGNRTQDQRAVFAPTNQAFLDFLAENDFSSPADVPNLANVLRFHIANPNVSVSDLRTGSFNSIQTILSGSNIAVVRQQGQLVSLNGQSVNILRSNTEGNGTIHVIDQILVP